MTPDPTTRCPVPGCGAEIGAHHSVCKACWDKMPQELRSYVSSAWRKYMAGRLGREQFAAVKAEAVAKFVGTPEAV